jgi:hypothetical protein
MTRTKTHNRRRQQALRNPTEREKRRLSEKARKMARNRRNARHG